MATKSFYQGGSASTEKLISEHQSLTFDVTAKSPAFEQLFRALGEIAQGNMVDTRNPADDLTSPINADQAKERVEGAMDLIQDALFNASANATTKNADLYSILAKVNADTVVLKNVTDSQTLIKTNLEKNITSLKNVNKDEAAVKLQLAYANLEASYTVLQSTMSLSLLNYLK